MVNDTIMLITASPEIHVVSEMRQYPKIYIKRLYDSTTLQVVVSEGENHCARGWWVHRVVGWVLGYFWGGQQARALYVEGAPGFFGSGRCAYDWTKGDRRREAEKERARQREIREKERPKSNVARFGGRGGGNGRGQKPSARICYAPWILDANHKKEPFIGNQEPTICPASRGSRKPRTSRLPTSRTLGNGCFLN